MNGEGKLYAKGKLIYEGQFKSDLFHGKGTLHNHERNTVYEGDLTR